ncbi:MAG TPA: metal ABC transporter substrate-binding protein [Nitrospira sp.]|nr:metal ABC transporter substrate-binding protein [Nitrospira sp.]
MTARCLRPTSLVVLVASIVFLWTSCLHAGQQPLNIVVTIPVLKDFAEQIGGTHVRVTSLLHGYENEHTYSPKPSDLIAVRNARLLFQVGIGLEVWVASLVENAGAGSLRVVTTSQGVTVMEDDQAHAGGHRAGERFKGNPHIWLDPDNAVIMIGTMRDALIQADPSNDVHYRHNAAAYLARLEKTSAELQALVEDLADRRFVAHHPAWPYLARRFRFAIVGTIQFQSASEPSARHLRHLIAMMKREGVKVVASEIQLSQKLPDLLSKETGARVVVLTTLPGGLPGTETYLDMLRYNVLQLVNALKAA